MAVPPGEDVGFGWGRATVDTGLHELASGIRCVENFEAKGLIRREDADPQLAAAIRDLVEPRTHTDPELKTDRRYTDLASREVRERLQTEKGYRWRTCRASGACGTFFNRMGYRRARVRKATPLKKTATTDAIFANVVAVRAESRPTPKRWKSRWTRRPRCRKGNTSVGGKTRTAADGTAATGWDHDPPAASKWTPGHPDGGNGGLGLVHRLP